MNRKKKVKKFIKIVTKIKRVLEIMHVRKYSHKFSKKTYNNWVHIILLALRQKMDKSYRGFIEYLEVATELLNELGIKQAPHFTTLQKAAKRLRFLFVEKIIGEFVYLTMKVNIRTGTDSTGLQPTGASSYYTTVLKRDKKKRRKIRKHLKLTTFGDLDNQLVIAVKIRRGPANDSPDFIPTGKKAKRILNEAGKKIKSHDADRGYDSELNHEFVVEELKAEDRIKLKNKEKPVKDTRGFYRKKAKKRMNRLRANYRSKKETIYSVIKRIEGSSVRSTKVSMQNKELLFKVIAYNANRPNIQKFLYIC